MPSFRVHFPCLVATCLAALAATPLASARILTSADGRTIDAEVIGFEGLEKVKIKRADTGRTFSLPLDSFAEPDREALLAEARAEAAKPPPPPGEKDVVVELSRKAKTAKTIKLPVLMDQLDGTREQIGTINVTNAESSYAITLLNRTKHPIKNLRIDYVLFAESDARRAGHPSPALTQRTGRATIAELPALARAAVNTVPIPTRKTTLGGRASWIDAGATHAPIELKGVWLRIYQGDTLVLENSSPSTLAANNPWPEFQVDAGPQPATSPHP